MSDPIDMSDITSNTFDAYGQQGVFDGPTVSDDDFANTNIIIPEKDQNTRKSTGNIFHDRGFDDKDLVIICTSLIAIIAIFAVPNSLSLVNSIITGLFGIAVGRTTR